MLHQMGESELLVESCFHLVGGFVPLRFGGSSWKLGPWSFMSGSEAGSGGRRVCGVQSRQIMALLLDD